ncbi:MAG: hypothetical protein AB1782_06935 [Cyanobacteriota bacterium]
MTQNINNNLEKLMNLSGNQREISHFQAPGAEEVNYFTQLAQQHKQARESALKSYFSTLETIETLNNEQESSAQLQSSARIAELKQKAQEFKNKADNANALFEQNQRLAYAAQDPKPFENFASQETHEPKQKKHAPKQVNDSISQLAVNEFKGSISGEKLTADEISEMYLRYSRQISINSPSAWSELDSAYANALSNAHTPDNTMDAQSKNAISNFRTAINPSMTKDEMMETFIRFSREVSVKYPEAWKELESILSNSLPNAYRPDTSMDAQSRNAISNFRSAINSGMTADEMNETFLRFSREVSIKFPEAWNELEGILSNYIPQAHKEDTSMDAQSRDAVANFKTALNSNMTKDEMVETFVRFSREVSVKYPDAWKELESTLNQNVPNAFKPNTTTDVASEQAVNDFKTSIAENHTKDDLIEMFLRFSRNISIKYPDKKNELVGILNNSLPNAYTPDTTIDKDSEELVDQFRTIIQNEDLDKDSFKDVFADYFKQISLNLTKARKMMNEMKAPKFRESEMKTEFENISNQKGNKIKSHFEKLVDEVNVLDFKVQTASGELQGIYNEDDQNQKKAEIEKLMNTKSQFDNQYFNLMAQTNGNNKANNEVKDDYLFNMSADITAPDKKEMIDRDTAKKTEWDMLRTMRRDDLKSMMEEVPTEALTEALYNVPKFHLINGLTLLPHEQQIQALTINRFEDALLREMPRKQLIEQLPDAYEMLPVLMMLGKTENGFRFGTDLIEDAMVKGKKVEEKPNETRQQEELLPFIMEQLLNKTPRMADAIHPSLGNMSPVEAQIKNFQGPGSLHYAQNQQIKTNKIEDLQPDQLSELAQEAMTKFNEDDNTAATSAKRGTSKNLMQFMDDMKKVDSVDAGKMAMSNLYNSQAQGLKDLVLPALADKELLKINKNYGRDPKEMVKEMPAHVVHKQLHDLSKEQLIQSYKEVGKDMIMNRLQCLPSQVLARTASDVLNRDTIKDQFYKNQNIA